MSQQEHSVSRRSFLQMVGVAGGAAAVYETMTALGLLNKPTAWAGPLSLARDRGKGQSVLKGLFVFIKSRSALSYCR